MRGLFVVCEGCVRVLAKGCNDGRSVISFGPPLKKSSGGNVSVIKRKSQGNRMNEWRWMYRVTWPNFLRIQKMQWLTCSISLGRKQGCGFWSRIIEAEVNSKRKVEPSLAVLRHGFFSCIQFFSESHPNPPRNSILRTN